MRALRPRLAGRVVVHVRRRLPPLRRPAHVALREYDLTTIIEREDGAFVVLWSPETAEHEPDYCELGRFPTRAAAEAFVATD